MKMIRGGVVAALAALACVGAAVEAPSALGWPAHSLWVGTATATAGGGTSCAAPGYNTIQSAVNSATSGQQIIVCAGTYTEQLQITKSVEISGIGTAVVKLPGTPANATTTCDKQMAAGNPGSPPEQNQDAISICGGITVSLTGITVDAAWASGTCYDAMYGIVVAGGATLQFNKSQVTAAGAVPLNGCQGGVGILDGDSQASPAQVGHLVVTNSTVSGYQKNGIVVDGTGSTGTIYNSIVTGAGPTPLIAQNGIVVGNGAGATITASDVSGDECNYPSTCGPDPLKQAQAAGIIIYATDAPVSVTGCTLSDNDMGIFDQGDPSRPAPVSPTAVIDDDRFDQNRYEAVELDQGAALVEDSEMSGGDVGLQALQYSGQNFGIDSVATAVTIQNMSVATVQVLSDQAAADKPGVLVVAGSQVHPGQVLNNSSNVQLIQLGDH
jgi:Right handed beta helix region